MTSLLREWVHYLLNNIAFISGFVKSVSVSPSAWYPIVCIQLLWIWIIRDSYEEDESGGSGLIWYCSLDPWRESIS